MKAARDGHAAPRRNDTPAAAGADDRGPAPQAASKRRAPGGAASAAVLAVALVTAAAAIGIAAADASHAADDGSGVAGAATASRLLLNALLAPALDADAQPLRFVDPRPAMACGAGAALRVDGRRLEPGALVPVRPFELHWRLDDCRPFGNGGPRFDGEVRLWVFREDHGFGAIVEPPAHDPLRITLADGRRHFIERGSRAMPQTDGPIDAPIGMLPRARDVARGN